MSVLQAIQYIIQGWSEVTTETISNCWNHTKILPNTDCLDDIETDNIEADNIIHIETNDTEADDLLLNEISGMLEIINLPNLMGAKELLNIPKENIVYKVPKDITEFIEIFKKQSEENTNDLNDLDEMDDSTKRQTLDIILISDIILALQNKKKEHYLYSFFSSFLETDLEYYIDLGYYIGLDIKIKKNELPSLDTTDSSPQNESTSGRVFTSWDQVFYIIESWAKQQEFNVIYNHVEQNPDRTLCKHTIQCKYQDDYNTKFNEPLSNNPSKHIYIITFNNTHSHNLNPDIIQFGNTKQIPSEIMKEIVFLTVQCKMRATSQRQYLEYQLPTNQHLEDIPDACQITASCMISDVNKNQIMSMWTVTVENKLVEKHFVILLTNRSHCCSCLSLINKGIICRHYFQIMLRSSTAKFHLKLIPSRWYYRNKDASKEPFLIANKFESDTPPIILQHSVPFLTIIHQISQNSITLHERLTDIQIYEDYLKDEEQNENEGGDSE
ncbi:hypothetical protein C1646_670084 [Rhizophagus diaphanus]|nr:hypothetical protein C1646_670084 [Rhizophagus diaphanus] [Rhizophagus sp. MUCL 43196]